MILLHILQLYKDKQVRGLHIIPVIFFTALGFWNLYYYPHLNQWWSFAGGIFIVLMNVVWCLQIRYYLRQERLKLVRKIVERKSPPVSSAPWHKYYGYQPDKPLENSEPPGAE